MRKSGRSDATPSAPLDDNQGEIFPARVGKEQQGITDDQVARLLPALAEAARANQQTVDRFVPPRIGIVDETAARRHHFILGRRGVGKSTLLRMVERERRQSGSSVAFIDLETLRDKPYPDVLIELIISLVLVLEDGLKTSPRTRNLALLVRRRSSRRKLRKLRRDLALLLNEPQSAEHTVKRIRTRASKVRGSMGMEAVFRRAGAGLTLGTGAESESHETHDSSITTTYTRTKMEGLHAAASSVREVLSETMEHLARSPGFIMLDDFYHIRHDDQPAVLAYLHKVVKNLEIYLKICGVRHRLNPFVEGDPPTGLQLGHDADPISLDITLASFGPRSELP